MQGRILPDAMHGGPGGRQGHRASRSCRVQSAGQCLQDTGVSAATAKQTRKARCQRQKVECMSDDWHAASSTSMRGMC